jgi:two-component system, sensor histidine kinase
MGALNELVILLAEDNPINQRIASLMFTRMGVTCDLASNGKEVTEMAQQKNYDLIFMDILMPVMDGLEATRKIRAFEKEFKDGVHTYIVALSATEIFENRKLCIEAGIDNLIEKPIKEPILRELLSRFI